MTTATAPTRLPRNSASLTAKTWRDSAACQGCDVEEFFDDRTGTQERIQGICRGCPVRVQCLDDTLEYEGGSYMRWGVVGGLTTVQRRALRCEALLGHRPNLRQARQLASPAWASRMMPLRQRGLSPQEMAVELRKHHVIASPVTVRLAVWWAGGKGGIVPRRQPGDRRHTWEIVRDGCQDIVFQLREMGVGNRDVAAYLLVSEDALGRAITAWRKAGLLEEVAAA
ncbi:WhiB family transcriptional regulator [Streptomyces osmaniensis]|uniref:4Fe-4S Wbl-type domain-containing protein n=1 Tax=Streptomyces osmaniensis TaxID=593134 RepID=A0ABP6YTW6_9ACTN|nr:WhiB family transcriptional regulator [Streptomyces sp. JCM17656]